MALSTKIIQKLSHRLYAPGNNSLNKYVTSQRHKLLHMLWRNSCHNYRVLDKTSAMVFSYSSAHIVVTGE